MNLCKYLRYKAVQAIHNCRKRERIIQGFKITRKKCKFTPIETKLYFKFYKKNYKTDMTDVKLLGL